MNRDDVIRMAREAGVLVPGYRNHIEHMERFASLAIENFLQQSGQYLTNDASREAAIKEAVEAEREECAKVCETAEIPFDISVWVDSTKKEMTAHTAHALAAAIRARGNHD